MAHIHDPQRCQWLMCRGYHRGALCGNMSVGQSEEGYRLCALHLGIAASKPICHTVDGHLSEHNRWRNRRGECMICGKQVR